MRVDIHVLISYKVEGERDSVMTCTSLGIVIQRVVVEMIVICLQEIRDGAYKSTRSERGRCMQVKKIMEVNIRRNKSIRLLRVDCQEKEIHMKCKVNKVEKMYRRILRIAISRHIHPIAGFRARASCAPSIRNMHSPRVRYVSGAREPVATPQSGSQTDHSS